MNVDELLEKYNDVDGDVMKARVDSGRAVENIIKIGAAHKRNGRTDFEDWVDVFCYKRDMLMAEADAVTRFLEDCGVSAEEQFARVASGDTVTVSMSGNALRN